MASGTLYFTQSTLSLVREKLAQRLKSRPSSANLRACVSRVDDILSRLGSPSEKENLEFDIEELIHDEPWLAELFVDLKPEAGEVVYCKLDGWTAPFTRVHLSEVWRYVSFFLNEAQLQDGRHRVHLPKSSKRIRVLDAGWITYQDYTPSDEIVSFLGLSSSKLSAIVKVCMYAFAEIEGLDDIETCVFGHMITDNPRALILFDQTSGVDYMLELGDSDDEYGSVTKFVYKIYQDGEQVDCRSFDLKRLQELNELL